MRPILMVFCVASHQAWRRWLGSLAVASAALLMACAQAGNSVMPAPSPVALGAPISLAVNGFNYTDLPIDLFSVGGTGGGNIFVSSPTSGGGGTTCCAVWRPGTRLPMAMEVEWMRNQGGRRRWCKKTVQLHGPVPAKPTALGVHFMPDGDIQLEITEGYPDVKLPLTRFDAGRRHETGNVVHDEEVARCRDVY